MGAETALHLLPGRRWGILPVAGRQQAVAGSLSAWGLLLDTCNAPAGDPATGEGEKVVRKVSEGARPDARITRRALLRGTLVATAGSTLLACQSAPEPRPAASTAGSAGSSPQA